MEGDNVLATQDDHPTIAPEDTEAQAAALSIDVPEDTGEGGKLRMIVQLVKRSFGVKDLAAMCAPNHLSDPTNVHSFSLFPGVFHSPASLLEPIPNLEYWHYLDRPDLFATFVCLLFSISWYSAADRINDHEDPLERMLAVLRFTFSKDIRHVVRYLPSI
jgi:hypothetical protein